jgi:thiamine pyrophosphokinase
MAPVIISGFTTPVRALVFAHGDPPSAELVNALATGADLIVAADGGADVALRFGIALDAVVGDLDSLSDNARARIPEPALHYQPRADMTDLEKAAAYCITRGCDVIDVVGAGGGRADHALGNLSVLTVFRGQAEIRLHDELFEVSLVAGRVEVRGEPGSVVSLIAIGQCHGVTTHGMRWDLNDRTLAFSPLGVHNEIRVSPASIEVREGDLLLFRGRWVEKHR